MSNDATLAREAAATLAAQQQTNIDLPAGCWRDGSGLVRDRYGRTVAPGESGQAGHNLIPAHRGAYRA